MNPWYGFQVVEIRGGFRTELLLFQTRGQRLRFMSVVEEIVQRSRCSAPRRPHRHRGRIEFRARLLSCYLEPGKSSSVLLVRR